jgi:acyl dehydratase
VITAERYAQLVDHVGQELGTSDWLIVDQDLIDRFADLTGDHMWVHSDPERAARELAGGRTIAHGLLTFSLIPQLSYQVVDIADPGLTFSYGTNRLRYVTPVLSGDRIRLQVTLLSADRQRDRTFLTFRHVMEIEGQAKPALVAEQVLLTHD